MQWVAPLSRSKRTVVASHLPRLDLFWSSFPPVIMKEGSLPSLGTVPSPLHLCLGSYFLLHSWETLYYQRYHLFLLKSIIHHSLNHWETCLNLYFKTTKWVRKEERKCPKNPKVLETPKTFSSPLQMTGSMAMWPSSDQSDARRDSLGKLLLALKWKPPKGNLFFHNPSPWCKPGLIWNNHCGRWTREEKNI